MDNLSVYNPTVGYILSQQDYDDGGYEATNGALLPGSGETIVAEALSLIEQLEPVISADKVLKTGGHDSGFEDFSQKGYDIIKKKLE